jgi:primosomal protein N'
MLVNRSQPIVAGLLSLSVAGIVGATALPFNDRVEYRIGNRIESNPAWLVPPKAEFRSLERGYGGIKILLSLLATGGFVATMLIARKEGELEPVRQRIKKYKEKAYEFDFAAESAYQMARTQQQYKTLLEADDVAFQGEIEQAYCQSLGIDPNSQQALLTGTATLESISNPGDKVEASAAQSAPAIEQAKGNKMPNLSKYPSVLVYGVPGAGKSTFTEEEVAKRLKEGHRVIVLDPHAACGQWEGCEVVGAGMDYEAIDAKLVWFQKQVKDRYQTISSERNPKFQPLTIVGKSLRIGANDVLIAVNTSRL